MSDDYWVYDKYYTDFYYFIIFIQKHTKNYRYSITFKFMVIFM